MSKGKTMEDVYELYRVEGVTYIVLGDDTLIAKADGGLWVTSCMSASELRHAEHNPYLTVTRQHGVTLEVS